MTLLVELSDAHAELARRATTVPDACGRIRSARVVLYGLPGQTRIEDIWRDLVEADQSMLAVCGQLTLLAQASDDPLVQAVPTQQWLDGVRVQLENSCTRLRAAASRLDRVESCGPPA